MNAKMSPFSSILVTGGAGFIGSSFVLESVSRGVRVVVLDKLTYAGHPENLTEVNTGTKKSDLMEFVQGDIGDPALVSKLLKEHSIDALVNFAAESHVDRSITGPGEFVETNVKGTYNLLNEATAYWKALPEPRRAGFRFLQISTDEVFGELGSEGKFSETTPYAPSSPYSASKASGDHFARAWQRTYGLPTLVTNCSNNYGPRQFPEKLIPFLTLRALRNETLPVYGKGENVRDWIHVEDHCRGLWLALEKGKPGDTYCFGGNSERQNINVVRTICKILDELKPRPDGRKHETRIEFVADRLGHDWRYAIDDSKAGRELGYVKKYRFEEGLRATVKWYLDNPSWIESVMRKGKKS